MDKTEFDLARHKVAVYHTLSQKIYQLELAKKELIDVKVVLTQSENGQLGNSFFTKIIEECLNTGEASYRIQAEIYSIINSKVDKLKAERAAL